MQKGHQLSELHPDLFIAKTTIYDSCSFHFSNYITNTDSKVYHACSFELNGKTVHYRNAKITPKKAGQFVAIWKRNKAGITEPFSEVDNIDYLIISVRNDEQFGQFIFPKNTLAEKGILTRGDKAGKRGIRLYPPWVITQNKQAEKTQQWQIRHFLNIFIDGSNDFTLARKLLV